MKDLKESDVLYKNEASVPSLNRGMLFGILSVLALFAVLIICVLPGTAFTEEPETPNYFSTESTYAFNAKGTVQLAFGDAIPEGAELVFFTKDDDTGEFTAQQPPIALTSDMTNYTYSTEDEVAYSTGVTLYAVITTDSTTIDDFNGMPVSEGTDYVVLASSVSPEEELILQTVAVQPGPEFSFTDDVLSLTVEKGLPADMDSSDQPSCYVEAGDTVVVTLVFKGIDPAVETSTSTVAGASGTWIPKIPGDAIDGDTIKWTGTFTVPADAVSPGEQAELNFEINFRDSFGTLHTINNGDSTCEAKEVATLYVLGTLTADMFTYDCVNSDPYDSPDERMIYAGETMNITVASSEQQFKIVSYKVNGWLLPIAPTDQSFTNEATVSHILEQSECPSDGDTISIKVTLEDLAGHQVEVSFPEEKQLIYAEPSLPPRFVTLTKDGQFYNGSYYVKQDDVLNVTVQAAKKQNAPTTINVWGNTEELTYTSDTTWEYTGAVKLSYCAGYDDDTQLPYSLWSNEKESWTDAEVELTYPVHYLRELVVDSVTMASNTSHEQVARDGDVITATVRFNHTSLVLDDDVSFRIAGVLASQLPDGTDPGQIELGSNQAIFYRDQTGTSDECFVIKYRLPEPGEDGYQAHVADNQPVDLVVSASDVAGNKFQETSVLSQVEDPVIYYAPLTATTGVTSGNGIVGPDGFWAVRNGETYTITIHSEHPINTEASELNIMGDAGHREAFVLVSSTDGYTYEATFTMGSAPLSNIDDLSLLTIGYTVYDLAGQSLTFDPAKGILDSGCWGRYYAPIEINDVMIESSNLRDKTLYAKDGDTIRVTFTSNHAADVTGSIAEHDADVASTNIIGSSNRKWTLTYTLQNGDLVDLATVPFTFTVADVAGNTPVDYTQESPGVTNTIKYYAPIEATASIASSNTDGLYAKNGDTITVTVNAQHETAPVEYSIGSYDLTSPEVFLGTSFTLSQTISSNEDSMPEGAIMAWVELLDPAGNTARVMNEAGETGDETPQIIYDRTAPEIRFAPGFNGATNQDVYLSIVYSDQYLNMDTVSCVVNKEEQITAADKANEAEPEVVYTHEIEALSEGDYYCTGTISDMAGNESKIGVSCSFIVDKTDPSVTINLHPNTFASGFRLDSILTIEEQLLSDVVCTVTDTSGVNDWALNKPMTVEGRKTVLLIAQDVAGNQSVPITCDLYIDTTAPQFTVEETTNGETLSSSEENYITDQDGMLSVKLAALQMGDEKPDAFTRLELLDGDGKVVADLLRDGVSSDGLYHTALPEEGTYTLVGDAKDSIGNKTGETRFDIVYSQTPWALIIGLSIGGAVLVAAAAGICIYIVRRQRRSRNA